MTTEYTPTTEDIALAWERAQRDWVGAERIRPQFDRWLAEHDRETRDEALEEAAQSFEGPDRFYRAVDVRRRIREGATR